jgi:hypothetical protein
VRLEAQRTARGGVATVERAYERRQHEQPERIEVKQAVAVDVHGTIYMVQKQRGGKSSYLAGSYGTPQVIGGDVPDGLQYMMYSLMGKTMPAWDVWQEKERTVRPGVMTASSEECRCWQQQATTESPATLQALVQLAECEWPGCCHEHPYHQAGKSTAAIVDSDDYPTGAV